MCMYVCVCTCASARNGARACTGRSQTGVRGEGRGGTPRARAVRTAGAGACALRCAVRTGLVADLERQNYCDEQKADIPIAPRRSIHTAIIAYILG